MPPIEWSMIQSVLLTRMLPSGLAAAIILLLVCWASRSEAVRSIGASLAFLAGLAAGNWQGQLVPYFTIETGWYALFSATCVAVVGGIVAGTASRLSRPTLPRGLVLTGVTLLCAIWLSEWPQAKSQPWIVPTLAAVMLLNNLGLQRASQSKLSAWVPLMVGAVWCGSATMVLVLAHSARFADLAILPSCALVAIGLVTFVWRMNVSSLYFGPATFIPALTLGGFLNTYSDIPWTSFTLIAIAPAVLLILYVANCCVWFEVRPAALAALLLFPCTIAVGLALCAEMKSNEGGHVERRHATQSFLDLAQSRASTRSIES